MRINPRVHAAQPWIAYTDIERSGRIFKKKLASGVRLPLIKLLMKAFDFCVTARCCHSVGSRDVPEGGSIRHDTF